MRSRSQPETRLPTVLGDCPAPGLPPPTVTQPVRSSARRCDPPGPVDPPDAVDPPGAVDNRRHRSPRSATLPHRGTRSRAGSLKGARSLRGTDHRAGRVHGARTPTTVPGGCMGPDCQPPCRVSVGTRRAAQGVTWERRSPRYACSGGIGGRGRADAAAGGAAADAPDGGAGAAGRPAGQGVRTEVGRLPGARARRRRGAGPAQPQRGRHGRLLPGLPYAERRRLLEGLEVAGPAWQTVASFAGDGTALLAATREQGLEGVVAKKLQSAYVPGRRTRSWLKVKHYQRETFLVGGFVPDHDQVRSLLVGLPDPGRPGGLAFSGRVDHGLVPAARRRVRELLGPLVTGRSPFAEPPSALLGGRWSRPG